MIPTFILQIWLFGLLSGGILGGAIYLGREWSMRSWAWDPIMQHSVFAPQFGANAATWILIAACVLATIALFGGQLVKLALRATLRAEPAGAIPQPQPAHETVLARPDGSKLRVRFYGPEQGIPIVCTHGWGLNSDEWKYLLARLCDGFRIVTWDLPGLGESTRPKNRDYSLENLAGDLNSVLGLLGKRPAILLGHSIGGMITLTFCRVFREALGTTVSGLVLTHTTPTNPVRTTSGSSILTAIEKPVLIPLMYLTIAFSPLLWLMNWLSYLNGSAHLSNKRSSFGGTETWEKVRFVTHFQPLASPAVLARGMLAMMKYDARGILSNIRVPTLVIIGDRDTTTKPEAGEEIERGVESSSSVTLSPAKHMGLIEHELEFAAAVRDHAFTIASKMNP